INSTLIVLNESTFSNKDNGGNYTFLNVQKNERYTDKTINNDHLIALESEAHQLSYLWNKV
ncbi:hypothetical protein V7196_19135, partial [Bacillus velezensis]